MNKRLQGLLIANGALVLLAGYALGFPFAGAVTAELTGAPASLPGDVRGWHMAHLEGVLNGMLMIAAAAAAGQLAMSDRLQKVIFWGLVVAGWTNVVASTLSPLTGGRGTGITGLDWNSFNFVVFVAGIIGAVAAAVALFMAGLRARKSV
ncbi:MAG: hypothetical protein K8R18_09025 [Parvibaculum sp.]|uniref:hypothetical protein n=1 Tax=Parvibaculum sp. TaxID=2024848 RepID=UPI0025F7740E|nr:hypothetical protein [Parvibaculum sp.]MCE9649751.1 hypothetical protein [Parvibaculum sp.]